MKSKRKTYLIAFAISLVAAVTLVFVRFRVKDPVWQELSMGAAVSTISAVILFVFTDIVFKDDSVDKNIQDIKTTIIVSEDIKRFGIREIKNKGQDDLGDFWKTILCSTNDRLFMMAHTLSPWFQEEYEELFFETIRRVIRAGHEVKLLILMPHSDVLNYMNIGETGAYSQKIVNSISNLKEIYASLSDVEKEHFHVRYSSSVLMPYMYIRNDSTTYFSPYLFNGKGRSNFVMAVDEASVFAKSFNQDFNEMFESCKDNRLTLFSPSDQRISKNNSYIASNWAIEDTYKYVFTQHGQMYEAGFYLHFDKARNLVGKTIELPTSYGCPFKCKYCASSSITAFCRISSEYLQILLENILEMHQIKPSDKLHIALTGTGDFFYTSDETMAFIEKVSSKYPFFKFTISSCEWTNELIRKVASKALESKIKYIQYTFINSDNSAIQKMIPNHIGTLSPSKVIELMRTNTTFRWRINYIMIKDYNDSDASFDSFIALFNDEDKKRITIRISKLNETNCSINNEIYPADDCRLDVLCDKCKKSGFNNVYIFKAMKNDNMNCGQLICETQHS